VPKKLNNNHGFTLPELLVCLAVIGVLAGVSLPIYRTVIKKNDLNIVVSSVVFSLRRAQLLSQAVDGDTAWGVKIQEGSITIFKGVSYATRDTDFDEISDVSTTISVGGTTEAVFAKFTGFPQTTGTINLSTQGDVRSVSFNEKGTIAF